MDVPSHEFHVDKETLSKFVWGQSGVYSGFFKVLAGHGGVFVFNDCSFPDHLRIEMTFLVGSRPLLERLGEIFGGQIPVDCSLFLQVLLQGHSTNTTVRFASGRVSTLNMLTLAKEHHASIFYFRVGHEKIDTLLRESSCSAKGQWVVRLGNDRFLGPQILSATEWKTEIASDINKWIMPPNYGPHSLAKVLAMMARVKIEIALRDEGIAINPDLIICHEISYRAIDRLTLLGFVYRVATMGRAVCWISISPTYRPAKKRICRTPRIRYILRLQKTTARASL